MTLFPVETLTPSAMEQLWALFLHGPTQDGHLIDKSARDQLVRLGGCERFQGWNWLNREGVEWACAAGYGDRKDVMGPR